MALPKVLAVIVNYNNRDKTIESLRSLISTDMPSLSLTVCIVENGSAIVERLTSKEVRSAHNETIFVESDVNLGFGGGVNLAVENAQRVTRFQYVFLLNNDATIEGSALSALVEVMEGDPCVAAVSPAIYYNNAQQVQNRRKQFWFGGGTINWRLGGARSPNKDVFLEEAREISDNSFATGCAMLIRWVALGDDKIFDPIFFMYCEDVDLCQRLLDRGYKVRYCPSASVLHDAHAGIIPAHVVNRIPSHWSSENLAFYSYHVVFGSFINMQRHAVGTARILGCAYLVGRYIRLSIGYCIHGRIDAVSAILRGFVDGAIVGRRRLEQ